ncbi:MAG: phosphoglycerate mutase family protein [Pseudobdellovibrionaceae bacterium]
MKIYLFRHAQKAIDFTGDPDLTPEGHSQALKLLDKVLKNEIPQPTALWVSPRKRTRSTFRPLSKHFSVPLTDQEALLEQQSNENLKQFRTRIEKVFDKAAKHTEPVIFLCSHYDWITEAMSVVSCDTDLSSDEFMHWSPCQYIGWENQSPDDIFTFIELKKVSI